MIPLSEDRLFTELLEAQLFYVSLLEYLTKQDVIMNADDYIDDFDPTLKQQYANEYPIKDIKDDLDEFISDWLESVKDECGIRWVKTNKKSGSYGFSNYITIGFERPDDRRLYPYFAQNKSKYDGVKFRFSEHEAHNDTDDIADFVDFKGKTFDQAAEEMRYKILNYASDLRAGEKRYLKQKEKERQQKYGGKHRK